MKKIITLVFSLLAILFVAISCATNSSEENPIPLKPYAVYTFNGHLYYTFYNHHGMYRMDDDILTPTTETDSYSGIKSQYDGYTEQVVYLLQAKDNEIAAQEKVIKSLQEYIKARGL